MTYSHKKANDFIVLGDVKGLEEYLQDQGVHPCVIREWMNEPERRVKMARRRMARSARKEANRMRRPVKGTSYRNVIRVTGDGYFHATKGFVSIKDVVIPHLRG